MFIPGPVMACWTCGTVHPVIVECHVDPVARAIVGRQACAACGQAYMYSDPLEGAMQKQFKKTSKRKIVAEKGFKARHPRSRPLPGMEDARIQPLENVAASYADIRDQRIALNKDEHALKTLALSLMKKYGKSLYRHEGIEIRVIPGEEDIKVKIKPAKEGEDMPVPDSGEVIEEPHQSVQVSINDANDAGVGPTPFRDDVAF